MNITINNGKLNMTDATKEELKALAEFMFADIPYNTVSETENVVVEVEPEVEPEVIEVETRNDDTKETITMSQICKKYGRTRATMEWHVKHGMKPIEGIQPKTWYVDDVEEYLSKHLDTQRDTTVKTDKKVEPIEHKGKLIVGFRRLSELTGKGETTLKWHIAHGMPYIDSEPMTFDYDECIKYLNEHTRETTNETKIDNSELDRYAGQKLYTIGEIASMNKTSHQLLRNRVKIHNIPYKKENNVSYFLLEDWNKEFSVHPLPVHKAKEITPFSLWRTEQVSKCKLNGRNANAVLSLAYARMTKVYGINWEQVRKDYFYDKNKTPNSTMQLAYYLQYEQEHKDNEHYEYLLENIIDELLKTK